eukprot:9474417-Pyramimonas_sp.AAC.1
MNQPLRKTDVGQLGRGCGRFVLVAAAPLYLFLCGNLCRSLVCLSKTTTGRSGLSSRCVIYYPGAAGARGGRAGRAGGADAAPPAAAAAAPRPPRVRAGPHEL